MTIRKILVWLLRELVEFMLLFFALVVIVALFVVVIAGVVYLCNWTGSFNSFIPFLGALIVLWLVFDNYWLPAIVRRLQKLWDYYGKGKHEEEYRPGRFKKDGSEVVLHRKKSDWQRDREYRRRFPVRHA